jgi:hypothetical protein
MAFAALVAFVPRASTEAALLYVSTCSSCMAILVTAEALGYVALPIEGLTVMQLVIPDKTSVDKYIGLFWFSYPYVKGSNLLSSCYSAPCPRDTSDIDFGA